MINYKQLANNLLDFLCEMYSPNECIRLLHDVGYTQKDICQMGFDKKDVVSILN